MSTLEDSSPADPIMISVGASFIGGLISLATSLLLGTSLLDAGLNFIVVMILGIVGSIVLLELFLLTCMIVSPYALVCNHVLRRAQTIIIGGVFNDEPFIASLSKDKTPPSRSDVVRYAGGSDKDVPMHRSRSFRKGTRFGPRLVIDLYTDHDRLPE
jgi:hypothetical protein